MNTIPDKSILKQMADASYQNNFSDDIDGFTLKNQTSTLKFFQSNYSNFFVVAVRGTADFQDFQAWIPTAINKIQDTERYKIDTVELLNFQKTYPLNSYTYYATGHSLAGSIIDKWLLAGYIKEARTYNPAIAYNDILNPNINNYRVYSDGDPLYNIMGRFATGRKEVRKYTVPNVRWWNIKDRILKQHTLQNPIFKGGNMIYQSLSRMPIF